MLNGLYEPYQFLMISLCMYMYMYTCICKNLYVYRNVAFVGGTDLAVNRWDNAAHSVTDEEGLTYPGLDYRQPSEKLYHPCRKQQLQSDSAQNNVAHTLRDDQLSQRRSTRESRGSMSNLASENVRDEESGTHLPGWIPPPFPTEVVAEATVPMAEVSCDLTEAEAARIVDMMTSMPAPSAPLEPSMAMAPAAVPVPVGESGGQVPMSEIAGDRQLRLEERRELGAPMTLEEIMALGIVNNENAPPSGFGSGSGYSTTAPSGTARDFGSADPTAMSAAIAEVYNEDGSGVWRDNSLEGSVAFAQVYDRPASSSSQSSAALSDMPSRERSSIMDTLNSALSNIRSSVKGSCKDTADSLELRDMIPRMPWHDVTASFSGTAARDVAAHFIQVSYTKCLIGFFSTSTCRYIFRCMLKCSYSEA